MTHHIGIVINKNSKELIMVVSPQFEEQLDDPCWTKSENNEKVMIKIPRNYSPLFNVGMTPAGVSYIQKNLDMFLSSVELD